MIDKSFRCCREPITKCLRWAAVACFIALAPQLASLFAAAPASKPATLPATVPAVLPATIPTTLPTASPATLPTTLPATLPTTFPTTRPATRPTTQRFTEPPTELPASASATITTPADRTKPVRSVYLAPPKGDTERYAGRFCIDGTMLAYGGRHWRDVNRKSRGWYEVVRWDLETAKAIDMTSGPEGPVEAIAATPMGSVAIVCSFDYDKGVSSLHFLNLDQAKETHAPIIHKGWVNALAITSDGHTAYMPVGSPQPGIAIWDMGKAEQTAIIPRPNEPDAPDLRLMTVDPKGRYLVVAGDEKAYVYLFGKRVWRPLAAHHKNITQLAISPDGSRLATGSADTEICLWNMDTLQLVTTLRSHQSPITAMAFSNDGKYLTTTAGKGLAWETVDGKQTQQWKENSLCLWQVSSGRIVGWGSLPQPKIQAVAFSPDGKLVRCLSTDLCEYKVDTLTMQKPPKPTTRPHGLDIVSLNKIEFEEYEGASTLQFTPDGRNIIATTQMRVGIWEMASLRLEKENLIAQGGWPLASDMRSGRCFIMDPNASDVRLVGRLYAYDWTAEQPLWEIMGYLPHVVTLSDDGKSLLTVDGAYVRTAVGYGGKPSGIRVLDTKTGRELLRLRNAPEYVACAVFSKDGRRAYFGRGRMGGSGYADCDIQAWDMRQGKPLYTLLGHKSPVSCLVVGGRDKWLYSGAETEIIKWDTQSRQQMWRVKVETPVTAMQVSPDGEILACGHADSAISFWNAVTGEPLESVLGFQKPVETLCFSPNGRVLASASQQERYVRFWQLTRIRTPAPTTAPRR